MGNNQQLTIRADENFFPKRFIYNVDTHHRHFYRYLHALELLGRLGLEEYWLDCACGSGYGTRLLSDFCTSIKGYDINREVVEYANKNYGGENCTFTHQMPTESADVIFCIETIEHMKREEAPLFLNNLGNLLGTGAELVVSTPLVLKSTSETTNRFHLYEYSLADLTHLLENCGFQVCDQKLHTAEFTDGDTKTQGVLLCKNNNHK